MEGKKMVVVAGMLSWRGTVKDVDTFQIYKDFLEAHNAIEVNGFRDIRELFA
jgi:extradiol dioxygenase family protein